MHEGQYLEKKSIRFFKNPQWDELAKDLVCFANSKGGVIIIGIDDKKELPERNQKINERDLQLLRKKLSDRTINVGFNVNKKIAQNGGEYIEIKVFPSQMTVASTSKGQYYIRVADQCKPVFPDELGRLFSEKSAFIWETKVTQKVSIRQCDKIKLRKFLDDIHQSSRVSEFIKSKNEEELLSYYQMYNEQKKSLTNLGILWLGTPEQRARLKYAPVVHFIKYDNKGNKINDILWNSFELNPKELINDIWEKIPDWKEGIEISEGIWGRKKLYHYNEDVIRELLSNALVHRNYSTGGDIFIKLFSDYLEISNPGPLPLGVTPKNILHKSIKRNEHLAKIFYDLNLMEQEGSGYDKIYEIQLMEGKELPIVEEIDNEVIVQIKKQIKDKKIIKFIYRLKEKYDLTQKETISLGIIIKTNGITSTEFAKILQIEENKDKKIKHWIGRLIDYEIVLTQGKTKGKKYFVNPKILKNTDLGKTDLKRITLPRLKYLILEDLSNFSASTFKEIHKRVGTEINETTIRKAINELIAENKIIAFGSKKFRKYKLKK